jgi:hypothetical protein
METSIVKTKINDEVAPKTTRRAPYRKRTVRTTFLGPLHVLLTKGLPDLVDEGGVLDTRKLAVLVGISYQALYKWFERNQVPSKRIGILINLSKKQKKVKEGFSPLVRDDFWEFLAR